MTYQGLFVSVDLGQTWSQTSIPNVNSGYADVQEVAGEIVVLEKDGDIWSLSNGSWVLRHSLNVSNLLMHQGDCFYSTHAGGYVWSNLELGLLLSRDEGDTWEVISSPVDGYLFGAFENDNRLVATTADGIWEVSFGPIQGCTDASACNYAEAASLDDGSCDYSCPGPGCCHAGTVWDVSLQQCVMAEPAYLNEPGETAVLNPCYFDSDDDGLVDVNDLMNLLTVYNLACGEIPETTASWQCGDPLEYQGYDYETVQIGGQVCGELVRQIMRRVPFIRIWMMVHSCKVLALIRSMEGRAPHAKITRRSSLHATIRVWISCSVTSIINMQFRRTTTLSIRLVCPDRAGFSIPGSALSGMNVAASKMKADSFWNNSEGDNTIGNESGFSVLPVGLRHDASGECRSAGLGTHLWSSTSGRDFVVSTMNASLQSNWSNGRHGFVVRCIKDGE